MTRRSIFGDTERVRGLVSELGNYYSGLSAVAYFDGIPEANNVEYRDNPIFDPSYSERPLTSTNDQTAYCLDDILVGDTIKFNLFDRGVLRKGVVRSVLSDGYYASVIFSDGKISMGRHKVLKSQVKELICRGYEEVEDES